MLLSGEDRLLVPYRCAHPFVLNQRPCTKARHALRIEKKKTMRCSLLLQLSKHGLRVSGWEAVFEHADGRDERQACQCGHVPADVPHLCASGLDTVVCRAASTASSVPATIAVLAGGLGTTIKMMVITR